MAIIVFHTSEVKNTALVPSRSLKPVQVVSLAALKALNSSSGSCSIPTTGFNSRFLFLTSQ